MLLIHFMGANLNKNPETSKCFGTFLSKKNKNSYLITTLTPFLI